MKAYHLPGVFLEIPNLNSYNALAHFWEKKSQGNYFTYSNLATTNICILMYSCFLANKVDQIIVFHLEFQMHWCHCFIQLSFPHLHFRILLNSIFQSSLFEFYILKSLKPLKFFEIGYEVGLMLKVVHTTGRVKFHQRCILMITKYIRVDNSFNKMKIVTSVLGCVCWRSALM